MVQDNPADETSMHPLLFSHSVLIKLIPVPFFFFFFPAFSLSHLSHNYQGDRDGIIFFTSLVGETPESKG